MTKKIITSLDYSTCRLSYISTLSELRDLVEDWIERTSEDAKLDLTGNDLDDICWEVYQTRLETDFEYKKRIEYEMRIAKDKKNREEKAVQEEFQLYEKLKEKYG